MGDAMSAKSLRALEQKIVKEAMGWHARQPYDLFEWMVNPKALVANLARIDIACDNLLVARKDIEAIIKKARK